MREKNTLPNRKEHRASRSMRAGAVLIAAVSFAACSDNGGGSSENTTARATTTGVVPTSGASHETRTPASSAAGTTSLKTTRTSAEDPRATQCVVNPNPFPGSFQECTISDGGIDVNGVPVYRFTNFSQKLESIVFSASEPVYVKCHIPQDVLPISPASLNGGGEYILGGEYKGLAVAAANNFYNPTMPPHELAYDPNVSTCDKDAIAAVTAMP